MLATYGITKRDDGSYTRPENVTTTPSGVEPWQSGTARKLEITEYWDRRYCVIVVENPLPGWISSIRGNRQHFVLDSWEHNWGRVPYFARPAFETESMAEETKFEGPLDALYAEAPYHNWLRTIMSNIAYMTGFAPRKVITKETGEQILDASGTAVEFIDFEPGRARQFAPGQDEGPVTLSPEVRNVHAEVLASEGRISRYSLDPISRGVAPGADTPNSAISQLRRLQRSALDPLVKNAARQARELYKFWLQRFLELGETISVYSPVEERTLVLSPAQIVSVNVHVKNEADKGMDNLLEEKQAFEMYMAPGSPITEYELHERRGKENPDQYVRASQRDRMRRMMEPIIAQQILTGMGQGQMLAQLIAANEQTGSARNAVEPLMQQAEGSQAPTGMGSGSAMMPRTEGVRSPALPGTTQPMAEYG